MVKDGEMIKEYIPDIIKGDFNCSDLLLTTLKHCPIQVKGSFRCNSNLLTSLEFSPKEVGGHFRCNDNLLTSLKFCPEKIDEDFWAYNNLLSSLEFAPKEVDGIFSAEYQKHNVTLFIEAEFVRDGYTNYWPDLFKYCIDNNIGVGEIKSWPDEFIKSLPEEDKHLLSSSKGINKFDL